MATQVRKSKFYRRLSVCVSVLLIISARTFAGDINPSNFKPFDGGAFYLLSEGTFRAEEDAKIRLDVPRDDVERLKQYGGIDIRLYRVQHPIEFLKKQKDLHRPIVEGVYSGEGLINVINYLWDSWYKKSRLAWQRILSFVTREPAVAVAPELKQVPPHRYQTTFDQHPQYSPVQGLDLVESFRYPVWSAKPEEPPKDVKMMGSSSNFTETVEGKVILPLGKQQPGLYLVEGLIGSFRATTLLFVSNSIAVTKLSSREQFVWVVDKESGKPMGRTSLLFTDGVGVIGQGQTADDGVFVLSGKNMERSYVLGRDKNGGVFVSENFYYDSEIYGNKIYIFTDRPLYRPGDTVNFKLIGREFIDSRRSRQLSAAKAHVTVMDSQGINILSQQLSVSSSDGGSGSFKLPVEASVGGYTFKVLYNDQAYLSSFRIANYVKPHFDVEIGFAKREFGISEAIRGDVTLAYPNGEAVKDGDVEIHVKKQKLTMVEGELQYLDRFPVNVSVKSYKSNSKGVVSFEIPEAQEPARYVVSARAVDQSSFRVTATREVLIQFSSTPFKLTTERNYSSPNEKMLFKIEVDGIASGQVSRGYAAWEAIRLQDQTKLSGSIDSKAEDFAIAFEKGGAYSISLKDSAGRVLASKSHWVQGPELAYIPGTISLVLDKETYDVGETAHLMATFSEPVNEALATLEREKVERYALLSQSRDWIKLSRTSDREFRADIPIRDTFDPNITFSIVYVANGRYFFENKGIRINTPKINVAFSTDKLTYAPGETVQVTVNTSLNKKPIETIVTASVVDEMIYVLQPEIAPDISDFFFHPRRNQVRTSSSLNFHTFDVATSPIAGSGSSRNYLERSLKVREKPRRDDRDTAAWIPTLKTDHTGRGKFSFVMPDSLTRWRITGRAIAASGAVGQRTSYIQSHKDFYIKWTGPTSLREGDGQKTYLALFNMTDKKQDVILDTVVFDKNQSQAVALHPGVNYVAIDTRGEHDSDIKLTLKRDSLILDELNTKLNVRPVSWIATHTSNAGDLTEPIPADARNIRLYAASGVDQAFFRVADYLLDYPYGCVEQTSSRLLPLALVYPSIQAMSVSESIKENLRARIIQERVRLSRLAGPNAIFSWWGDQSKGSAFLTAYATYTDWMAAKAVGVDLPMSDRQNVLEAYKKSEQESLWNRTVAVWFAAEMGLPVKTLVSGLVESVTGASEMKNDDDGMFGDSSEHRNAAMILIMNALAKKSGLSVDAAILQKARAQPEGLKFPLYASAYLLDRSLTGLNSDDLKFAEATLNRLVMETPTSERGVSLAFISRALGAGIKPVSFADLNLGTDWQRSETKLGGTVWRYRGSLPLKNLPSFPQNDRSIQLVYEVSGKDDASLPVKIERSFHRLTNDDKALKFSLGEAVNEELSAKELYVDRVVITPSRGGLFKYGLAEMALPPGGEVEQTTWGIMLQDEDGKEIELSKLPIQKGDNSYSVAIPELGAPVTITTLVRFSQVGQFQIPPSRFFRMYAPGQKAYEKGDSLASKKITVR